MFRILYNLIVALTQFAVRSGRAKDLKIIVLRHQLTVLRRQHDQPKLDKQEDIYADLLVRIGDAISLLDAAAAEGMNNAGAQDILYGGDPSRWLGLAHAVKARLLLNTSFNVLGEPIVETPEDARACFAATAIDCLVLGEQLIERG